LPESLKNRALSDERLDKIASRDGMVQLGTLGRGNHFLEFQADEEQRLWMMVHSGSRAMGQAITNHHVRRAQGRSASLTFLDAGRESGLAYLSDVSWARDYAAASRLMMPRAVEAILAPRYSASVDWSTLVHSDHDHVQRETHFGEEVLVHRKGAQSARSDEMG